MRIIILDLEWDSGYHPKYKRFLNQILQIGAVMLDETLRVLDTFEATIRSSYTKRVTGRFAALTGITTQKMREGISPVEAVTRYNQWAGSDTVTLTWSTSDLFAILENEHYLLDGVHFHIEKYLDLQRYIQNEMARNGSDCQNQIALCDAASAFGISTEQFELHTALDDSMVCVALLQKTFCAERFDALMRDTRDPEFYRRLCFKPYYIDSLGDAAVDRSQLKFRCEHCGGDARRMTKWKYRNRWFYADFRCKACREPFTARISFKKTYDDVVVKKRIEEPKKPKQEVAADEVHSMPETVRQ